MRNFFYIIDPSRYLICDPENCADNERGFEISFNNFSKDPYLLGKLNLVNIYAKETNAIDFMVSYLSSFGGESEEKSKKMKENPTLRILIEDRNLKLELEGYFD